MPRSSLVLVTLAVSACSGEPAPAPPAPVAAPVAAPAVPSERVLTEQEYALLRDDLEDLRAGVRPFDAESLGVCAWDGSACSAFVGRDAGVLPPGSYQLWAELRAPRLGADDGWPVTLHTECTTTGDGNASTHTNEKTYTVRYAGTERGFRMRLRPIESPNVRGEAVCSWTLTSDRGGGDGPWSGSWTVPAAAE